MKIPSGIANSALAMIALSLVVPASAADYYVFFGTYTRGQSKGIYRSHFDTTTGKLSAPELAVETRNPSFIALHPNGKFLYSVDEGAKEPGRGVNAFALDPATGSLKFLNEQSAAGADACHLSIDRDGKVLLVANYSSGSIASIHLESDGRLGAMGSQIQHTGSSVNRGRQAGPHAHEVALSPDNRFVFVPDLGLDHVMIYDVHADTATLTPHNPPFATMPPGSGPRHMAFHPNGKIVYVIDELLCTIVAFNYDAKAGTLTDFQNILALPPGETKKPNFSGAEIAVHPNGKFVYASSRGLNAITVFSVAADTGQLTPIQGQPTLGRTPRHFTLDPTGNWLIVENQDTSNVAVFKIDPTTGQLTGNGDPITVPIPVCALFVPVK